ncbi:hypothetical protein B0T13DRAFT_458656 [Neurospora crassa]|nr:hypothetical protein B0T13DRAFT_458656 [Neurospora crassa]
MPCRGMEGNRQSQSQFRTVRSSSVRDSRNKVGRHHSGYIKPRDPDFFFELLYLSSTDELHHHCIETLTQRQHQSFVNLHNHNNNPIPLKRTTTFIKMGDCGCSGASSCNCGSGCKFFFFTSSSPVACPIPSSTTGMAGSNI